MNELTPEQQLRQYERERKIARTVFISKFDPDRETIGKIYCDAQATDMSGITVGDINNVLLESMVEDVNNAIKENPFNDRPYYITIAEKWDLQLKKALVRQCCHTLYRPWPEDATCVFWHSPKQQSTRFCWDIPHFSNMANVLHNPYLYPLQYPTVKAWAAFDMDFFGFFKHKTFNSETLKYEEHCFPVEDAHLRDKVLV